MIQLIIHPECDSLNKELESWINFLPNDIDEYTNLVVEKHTGFYTYPKPFLKVKDWVVNQISPDRDMEYQLWAAVYNYGDFAHRHSHIGESEFSFVYYISTPEGSSPLIFDDFLVEPISGLCVIFDSTQKHYVPENKCNGRKVLAGNLRWSPIS